MFELTKGADLDVLGLQTLSESVVTDEVAQLRRHSSRRHAGSSYKKTNVCLVTLNNVLNGANILNILNGFGDI